MDCTRMHELLDAWLTGALPTDQAAEFRAHLDGCGECADVVATLSTAGGFTLPDEQVVRPVVAATTGRGCSRVHELLAADPDSPSSEEAEWARDHAAGCTYCAQVAAVLDELPRILPGFASVDPGPDFTAEVLLATLEEPSLWDVFVTRVGDHLRRWQRRPSFAQELSYALTVALLLITIIPGSPLSGLPRQALSLVQVQESDAGISTQGTVGAELRREVRTRGERLGSGFDRLGTHVIGAGRGLVDGDLEVVGENAGQIGCDLRRLWTGVREPAIDPESICG